MNIQKTLSTFMALSMLFTSVSAMPVGNAYAEDDDELSWYDDHAEEVLVGYMSYYAPDKVIYKVGEDLDITGGICKGSGGIVQRISKDSYDIHAHWDNFGRDYTLDELDLSGFDNTKPGVYQIMPAVSESTIYKDEIEYSGFSVMVVDGENSEENYVSMVGDYEIDMPYDPFLKVGESIEAHYFGGDLNTDWHYEWHHNGKVDTLEGWNFSTGIHEYSFDFSEVDNTKPGIYRITPLKQEQKANVDKDEINYGCCYIMVTDGEPTEAEKNKLQAINEGKEAPPAESVKGTAGNVTTTETAICGNCGKEIPESEAVYGPLGWPVCRECYDNGAYVGTTANFDLLTAATTTTTAAENVKCEYCGKETPKSEAVYGPLGFPVCRECYDNGAYVGTTANFNPPTTTTTTKTVTNTVTTTVSSTSILYTGDQQFEFLGVNTYPTKTVFEEGDEFKADGMNVTLRRYIPYEELGFNREDFAPEKEFESEISFSAKDVDIIDKNNKKYSGTEFPTLPAGKYIVQIKGNHRTSNDIRKILGVYITYEIEIKSSSVTTTTQPATSVTTTTAPVTTYPDFGTNRCIPLADVTLITEPTKTVYNIGEKLDLTGIKVRTVGGFGDSVIGVESIELLTDYKKGDSPSLFANDYHFDSSKPGTYTIVLSFYGREETPNASFDVTVVGDDTTDNEVTLSGDANCDKKVDISDSVLIMQTIANPAKYKLSKQGRKNADIIGNKDGITNMDALQIQKKLLKLE